jgi:acetylornithine deacetylase/succinyl-diaminopimelate desuccinylase-like protein
MCCLHLDEVNLYGRGACDVKSLIAAMLIASLKLSDIGLLFVVSEETDHSGIVFLIHCVVTL